MNIVFDLGGVLLNWNPDEIISRCFRDPEVQAVVRKELFRHQDWHDLDRGTLEQNRAIERAAQRTGLPESDISVLMDEVRQSLVVIPETLELVKQVKSEGHALYCLSNMHVASIRFLKKRYDFWRLFDGEVFSCYLHYIKPEPEIYAYLLDTFGLESRETIFVDDVEVNLTAAADFGIQTIQFESPQQCERELRKLGVFGIS